MIAVLNFFTIGRLSRGGIATLIAATMIGEIGDDRTRFPSVAALLAEAGLAPMTLEGPPHHRRLNVDP